MPQCNKCKTDQPENNFYTYWHSTQNKYRTRRICNTCMYIQKRKYLNRPLKPDVLYGNNPEYKKCEMCNTWKIALVDFYLHSNKKSIYKRCKTCQKKKEAIDREIRISERGGSERVPPKPNTYTDKYQKAQTFQFMELLGWIFNEATGKWYKPGIRDIEGNFEKFKNLPDDKVFIKGSKQTINRSRITVADLNLMKQMKKDGHTNSEIGYAVNLNPSTVSKWVGQRRK